MKNKSTIIKYVIYPFSLLLIVGDDDFIEKTIKEHSDEYKDDYIFFWNSLMTARVEMLDDGLTVMAFKEKPNAGLVAHEALHAVDFLMNKIGNVNINESWNYLLQYTVDEITKFLKNE